jgi:putative addiction module component (TIGR02574 family)
MTIAAYQVLQDALGLAPSERAELIDALLHSFDPSPDQERGDAWRAEAESRIAAFGTGQLTDASEETVIARILGR